MGNFCISYVSQSGRPASNPEPFRYRVGVGEGKPGRFALIGLAFATVAAVGTPDAGADPGGYDHVVTTSGQVRCILNADGVSCEHGPGFPQAPMNVDGMHDTIARVTSDGQFLWGTADIGGGPDVNWLTLDYGQTFTLQGWAIEPSVQGTKFTCNATGRGMFVSVENVSPF